VTAVRWAALVAIPPTVVTGWLFQKTPVQAQWQSLLAIAGVGPCVGVWIEHLAAGFDRAGGRSLDQRRLA
jgi:hypothetical protein